MKRWAWLLAVPILMSFAGAQVSSSLSSQDSTAPSSSSQGTWHNAQPGDRMFFPRDMLWAWVQVDLAPPHNEIDPNQCGGNAGQYGGVNAPCSLFARYMIWGTSGSSAFWPGTAASSSWSTGRQRSCLVRRFRKLFTHGLRMLSASSIRGESESI